MELWLLVAEDYEDYHIVGMFRTQAIACEAFSDWIKKSESKYYKWAKVYRVETDRILDLQYNSEYNHWTRDTKTNQWTQDK